MNNKIKKKEKYYFFLNPYTDSSFTRCPKCDNNTKVKKLPLAIVLEKKKIMFMLNKTCKFCPYCELLIAKKSELHSIIMQFLGVNRITEKDFTIIGTQDKIVYREGLGKGLVKENPLEGVSLLVDEHRIFSSGYDQFHVFQKDTPILFYDLFFLSFWG